MSISMLVRVAYAVVSSGFGVACLVVFVIVVAEHDRAFVIAFTALLTVMWGTMAANAWRRLFLAVTRRRREQ